MSSLSIPAVLRELEILVPCKVDVKLNGARYVDCFLWNLYNSVLSPDEFAASIARDLALPIGFRSRIAMQLCEQVEAFADLMNTIYSLLPPESDIIEKLPALNKMAIGLRHLGMEYSDSFDYNVLHSAVTPEDFAVTTCADLGLPSEMEPAIALKIRDTIINLLTKWLETLDAPPVKKTRSSASTAALGLDAVDSVSSVHVGMVPSQLVTELTQNIWRTSKPTDPDAVATAQQPTLPQNSQTNGRSWTN